MKYLLNREAIQKSALRGFAEIANDQPVSPANRYHNPNLKPRDFDPDKAKALFEKAGVLGADDPDRRLRRRDRLDRHGDRSCSRPAPRSA